MNDLRLLNERGDDLVGHQVEFRGVQVSGTAAHGGFWIRGPQGQHLFVLPSGSQQSAAPKRATVDIQGVVLQMPRGIKDELSAPGDMNDDVYILATNLSKRP